MAAPAVVRSSGPPLCPSFAEVCSFLERYGPALDLPEMTFPQMERYLRDTAAVPKPLVDLHVKLLRKLGKSVTTDRWEKYLAKVCQELNSTWAWELEQKGYQEMSMECKSSILKYLCECQFDDNLKFKTVVNEEDPEKMRLQPVGRDQLGLMYWLQLDQEQNIRLYTEEQDDLDGSTWKCIVRTRNDLAEALELLKAQIEPNQSQDQNQAGGGSPAEKQTGENEFGTSDAKLLTATEEEADNKLNLVKDEKPLKQGATQEEVPPVKQENPESVVMDKKPSAFDNRVSTITAVKSEPGDANTPKDAVPIVMATTVSLTKLSKDEEAKLAVVRSNQQAKIPLKKRDLKLADSFHSNHLNNSSSSSIIVCNPAAISSKDGKLLNSLGPQGGPASSQQQVVMAPRQELTNGRASHLPHKEGQNGVLGVTGQVVGHVGVIRSPSEYHRAPSAGQQEQNGPRSEPCGPRAVEEDKEVGRKSVLVRKGLTEPAATPAATFLPPDPATEDQKRGKLQSSSQKPDGPPEAAERKVGSVGAPSVSSVTVGKTDKDQDKNTKESGESRRQKDEDPEELGKEAPERRVSAGVKGDPGNTSARGDSKLSCTVLSLKIKKWDKTDQLGLNGGLASRVRLKSSGAGSEQKQGPLEEASSELQKEGIRLKIKIPPHRRNKLKKKGGKEEEEKEREVHEEGRSLRRSARICRPSSKAAESQRKKPQKKQVAPARARGEEEAAEEEGDDKEHGSPAAKDRKAGPAGKLIKRRGKRRHGRPRWTNIRPKRRRPNEEEEVEDRGRKRGADEDEDEEEGVSHSEEESCKSEHVPSEDACTHCGLPNHPELILLCDSCDRGYHTACLRPPLMLIPDGEWFCPPCQHKMLCENLEEQLQNLDSALKKRERAERRRERLVYVGISVENIIPEGEEDEEEEKTVKPKDPKKSKNLGRRSTRTRKHISYRFDDFDDAIDEAIEEDVGDLCGGGAGRGKDIASVLSEDGKDSQRPIRSQTRSARNRKRRRLNDLESDSTAVESEDEFMLSNSSEDEEFGASGADDDGEEDDEDAGSDVGSWDKGTRPRRGLKGAPKYKPKRTQRRSRRRRRRRSTEEEEDTDIDMDSDQFSDMTDSDAEKKRRGLRRGQHQQVNYRETSESSDNSRPSTERVKVKRRGRPRKERLSSDFSDVSHSSKDSEEEDEEEDDQRRGKKRRREEREDLRGRRRREKQRGYEEEKDAGEGGRVKKRQLEKNDKRRLSRTEREEEDLEKMGRGKRREILSQQRRRRLAQMLKKRRPSTDEEEESEDSESSSEEDRPIRKRLNRIDSDDEEDEGQKAVSKRSSAAERRAGRRNERDAQEKGRGRSPSSSNRHQASRGPEKPGTGSATVPRDSATSGGQKRHNGPLHEDEEYEEEEEGQSSSVNSVQNSPRS